MPLISSGGGMLKPPKGLFAKVALGATSTTHGVSVATRRIAKPKPIANTAPAANRALRLMPTVCAAIEKPIASIA